MRKYWQVFKIALSNVFEYRFDFIMGRVRNIILLLTLYFLWSTVFANRAELFGFNKSQIIVYILFSNIIFSTIFVHSMDDIANDISMGQLSSYLVKPINYLAYWFARRIASRLVYLLMVFLETWVFLLIVGQSFSIAGFSFTPVFWVILLLSLAVFTVFDFVGGLLAFWTLRAYGPRFMFKIIMEFASGRYFPLAVLPFGLAGFLKVLPFAYMTYWPTLLLLGNELNTVYVVYGFLWLVMGVLLLKSTWKKGLKAYEAYGG